MIYIDLQKQFQADFAKITFFAFSKDQFTEKYNTPFFKGKKLLSIGVGGYIRKKDRWKYDFLHKKYSQDVENMTETQLIESIVYEMHNHEYCYSYDMDTIVSLFNLSERHNHIIDKAVKRYWKEAEI
jgi:hypothetical protein